MQCPPIWRFKFISPSWMNQLESLSDTPPSFGYKDFEGELKIPEHVHKYIDFEFMCDWFSRINKYAEFEFQCLLDIKSRENSKKTRKKEIDNA